MNSKKRSLSTGNKFATQSNTGRYRKIAAFLLLLPLTWLAASCDSHGTHQWSGQTMGTFYRLTLTQLQEPQHSELPALEQQVAAELEAVNAAMSTYLPNSEISRFNSLPAGRCLPITQALLSLVREAVELSLHSNGAFNALVGPLVERWSFGPANEPFEFPQPDEIQALLALADLRHISYSEQPAQLCKHRERVQLDLSAIAKGYAVDRIAQLLEANGYSSYLVDIGGELKVAGLNSQQQLWQIAIEEPTTGQTLPGASGIHAVLRLTNQAVATSGDYRNFFEHEGERYSHTIDPQSGYPIRHGMASVTVVDTSAASADGWATALLSAGPLRARELAEKYKLAVYFIQREAGEVVPDKGHKGAEQRSGAKAPQRHSVWYSSAFERYLVR